MDISLWVMIIAIGWTVVGLILVAALWSRAPWKAVIAWLGIALVPLGLWLAGLSQAAIDGWNTLALWWQGLIFTLPVMIGVGLLGLAALLLVVSRLVPNRPRKRKQANGIPSATTPPSYRPTPPRSEAEQTLILPENRPNP
ncbi:hypothetical protein [Micropruina sp.]|uniref:hypothetical protein n=1 Tax=Micropruina sp. TaxID=2737536 RepID=UPI00262A476E|nr:hypothetical protein [Micropruina sp.]